MIEQLYINNIYVPLSKSINPSITRSITDIQDPSSRKATYSKTTTIPNSKEAFEVFGAIFDINLVDGAFDVSVKPTCVYIVDGSEIINGYCQLKDITITDSVIIDYQIVMYGNVASLMNTIKGLYLTDLDLSEWDHPFTQEIQVFSWATKVWNADLGAFVTFALGTGYVYALVDYGFSSDSITFKTEEIGCSIYVKEYWDKIFSDAGFTYTSTFLNSTAFKSLIIPASPETYALTAAEITAREFSANTPTFTSTGTTTSANLSLESYGANDTIIFGVDVSDPSGLYDTATGIYTVVNSGFYTMNAILELNGYFDPTTQPAETTSEIRGKIRMIYTPISSGVPAVIDEVPFFITRGNGVATSDYPYTTATSPTYPDDDYTAFTTYSYATTPIPRNLNPPDRYMISTSGVYLSAGDTVKIATSTGFFNGISANYFDSGGGNAKLICSVAAFYNKVTNTIVQPGNTFSINKAIPIGIKQNDFIESLINRYNLYVDIDPNNAQNLIIEPRDDFYGSTIVSIDDKVAIDKGIVFKPMGALDARRYIFQDKEDQDYWNTKYKTSYQEPYGSRTITVLNDFVQNEKRNKSIFSPTPIVGLPNNDRVLPTIIGVDSLGYPISTKHNIRILHYGGLKANYENWQHSNTVAWYLPPILTANTTYPYAGHFDDPFTPTLDINFGLTKELYYDSFINPVIWTNNNLYNKYWSKFITEITDKDSKIVECYVNMSNADFNQWSFQDSYFFNNAYHRLYKINGYNPTNSNLTKCEFLKMQLAPAFAPTSNTTTGAPTGIQLPTSGDPTDNSETAPVYADGGSKSNLSPDGNNSTNKTVQVVGEGNFVSKKATNISVQGSGNFVYESKNVTLTNSHDNIINSGLTDIVLINTTGITVSENFVTYIDGKQVNSDSTQTANFTTDDSIGIYYLDATAGDMSARPPATGTDISDWIFKRIDNTANTAQINPSGATTIDGELSFYLAYNESIRIKWNNELGEYSIIN